MPRVESFAIGRWNGERCHLAFREAERLGIMDVVPEKCVDFVGIKGTVGCISMYLVLIRSRKSITIVARVVSAAHQ